MTAYTAAIKNSKGEFKVVGTFTRADACKLFTQCWAAQLAAEANTKVGPTVYAIRNLGERDQWCMATYTY